MIALALVPCAALLVWTTSSAPLNWPQWAVATLIAEVLLCWALAIIILFVGLVGTLIDRGSQRMAFCMAVGAALAMVFLTAFVSLRVFARR